MRKLKEQIEYGKIPNPKLNQEISYTENGQKKNGKVKDLLNLDPSSAGYIAARKIVPQNKMEIDRPEKMDPSLVRKLKDPTNLYATNPAMRKGSEDVQRLISKRFGAVADKLRQVTGIEDLSSQSVMSMLVSEMMRKVQQTMRIESSHKEELEELAKEIVLDFTGIPDGWVNIEAHLTTPSSEGFRTSPESDEDENDDENDGENDDENNDGDQNLPDMSFDIEDLTPKEILELEKHKRNIINAIIQGASKKGHYLFQDPSVKNKLDAIDSRLYQNYLAIMSVNDFLYFTMESLIEMMSGSGSGIGGKVELKDFEGGGGDEDGDGEEGGGESEIDTTIVAQGVIFPILCHEIIKGIEEAKGRHGLPEDPELSRKVMSQTDTLPNEAWQLRIGPEIVERIRFSLPDELFEPENKELINWFHIVLYKTPAKEFLSIVGDVISQDPSKNKKASQRFDSLLQEARNMKQEFDDYKSEKGIESDDEDDDEGLDDFLGSLGISRPK